MYEKKDPHAGLELSAVMLNISGEHNQKLKEACRTLREYSIYTDKVRKYVGELELADAVERAIRGVYRRRRAEGLSGKAQSGGEGNEYIRI